MLVRAQGTRGMGSGKRSGQTWRIATIRRGNVLSRSTLSILVAAALAALPAASAGAAEPHRLLPRDCVTSPGDAAGCGATATGLGDPRGVAVSPDGADVYVAATGDDVLRSGAQRG